MKSDKDWRALASPHETASVAVYWFRNHISVSYLGQPEALIAAGAIEPAMALPGRRGLELRDSFGDRFRRDRYKDGDLRIQRLITSTQRARSLPGVPPDAVDESDPPRLRAAAAAIPRDSAHSGTRRGVTTVGRLIITSNRSASHG